MIGVIPAGGKAVRMQGLPKMLLPASERTLFEVLLERMGAALPRQILIAPSKATVGLLFPYFAPQTLAYATYERTMTEDVLLARYYLDEDEWTLFGMPDTYFDDAQAFPKLAQALNAGADVAVGIFKVHGEQHKKLGMVELDDEAVVSVVEKPNHTTLKYAWGVLAWKPIFWNYLRESDPHVGYALPYAIDAGLKVRSVMMEGGYWDCGTIEEYHDLVRHLTGGN